VSDLFLYAPQQLQDDFFLLKRFVESERLSQDIKHVINQAPLRKLTVPGGKTMSVAMTNCGSVGWISDALSYRYSPTDPTTNLAWPTMPSSFLEIAKKASSLVGFDHFTPDACLINQYSSGAGMGLHQDRDERDLSQPIVSVSIGDSCKFIVGGTQRKDPQRSFTLSDGDVLVWGGRSRLVFHGVRPMPRLDGVLRFNLTLRKAG
jgi:DNA oxidative demethylase